MSNLFFPLSVKKCNKQDKYICIFYYPTYTLKQLFL